MTSIDTSAAGVDIESLNLSFDDTHVLKGIDLSIEPGEFFAFLGPSGSGKSTLLRAIAGFGPTPKGRILIGGEEASVEYAGAAPGLVYGVVQFNVRIPWGIGPGPREVTVIIDGVQSGGDVTIAVQ